ncbi:TPA: glycosyltransferase [Raoultella planticola]
MIKINNPTVTIYISTCNRLEKLKRAIASVIAQTYEDWELIVCDDASSDGTLTFMSDLCRQDPRIKYLRNEINQGACATRNLGIFNASGKFITGLDDDDEFTSERISFFVKKWDDKYSFLCCNFLDKYVDGHEVVHYKKTSEESIILSYKDMLFDNTASNQIFTLTSRLRDIGGFDQNIKRLQDWDTWLRLSYSFGSFVRFSNCTYIMHHDHGAGELRVSQNEKLTESLLELVKRNNNIYSIDDSNFMKFIVEQKNKKATIIDGVFWSIRKRNPKYFIKCLLTKLM